MSDRSLEDRAYDAVVAWARKEMSGSGEGGVPLRLAISTALTLARREGYEKACSELVPSSTPDDGLIRAASSSGFPLPTRTVRNLREERDPEGGSLQFSFDGEIMCHEGSWSMWCTIPERPCAATPARVDLWFDLMQRPYHEEEQAVDPNEVLPP